jgi:hypothetical protein
MAKSPALPPTVPPPAVSADPVQALDKRMADLGE